MLKNFKKKKKINIQYIISNIRTDPLNFFSVYILDFFVFV